MKDQVRVALVTGASRGIGRAIAVALGGDGWTVVVNYQANAEAAAQALAAVQAAGGQGMTIQADIAAAADRERLLGETLSRYNQINLLVNNAGMAPRQRVDLLEATETSYDEVMAVNLKGPFFFTQLVAKAMIAQSSEEGIPQIIVNIGSMSAYTSSTNRAEYCLSKAGVGMMTRLYADRLAEYGINVYEIRPGIIATDMTSTAREKYDRLIAEGLTSFRRWGRPEDVALAVQMLAAGCLPFSTGEVINVDGGFHLRRL
jgi:NAD(P)-dependent dehydrogenase (short-subunit alcohol dehydrogenase family)